MVGETPPECVTGLQPAAMLAGMGPVWACNCLGLGVDQLANSVGTVCLGFRVWSICYGIGGMAGTPERYLPRGVPRGWVPAG